MTRPYTVILSQASSKQYAELLHLVAENNIFIRLPTAAFDTGVSSLLAAVTAGEAITFPTATSGTPIEVPHSPFRQPTVDELLAAVATRQEVAEAVVLTEAFCRGLDKLTTHCAALAAKRHGQKT